VVINNAAGVKEKVQGFAEFCPFYGVHSNSGLLARLASGKGCTYFQPMAFLAAHTTSAALAGQATSCIGAEPVSLLLALISYSIGIGHEYKVQNMAYAECLMLGPRQSSKSPMLYLWWWTRLTYVRRSWDDLKWLEH